MGGLIPIEDLLSNAAEAGLRFRVDGQLLRISGARKNTAIAKELLDRKTEVLAYLAPDADENPETHDSQLLVTTDRIRAYRQKYHPTADNEPVEKVGTVVPTFSTTDEACPICHAPCLEQTGKTFRHVWCPRPGHFDSWRAMPGHKLGEAPVFDSWRAREKKNVVSG